MTVETEEYISLNQPENENPSTVSFIQDNYENLKNKIQLVGFRICGVTFLTLNFVQFLAGLLLLKHCYEDKYAPAYFIVSGLIGFVPKIAHCTLHNNKRHSNVRHIFYVFYIFEFIWLVVGTYYYVLTEKFRQGCTSIAYKLAFWLIICNYMSVIISLLIFCWALSIIFVLVYFKNKIVQYLAKSLNI